ncbi:hypothetical protein C8R48DRAFT_758983 [Suillus tomentosus]|nr:hypothetical protein C8R48DRAFT_758983 [Suillus tomentosus]
MNLTGCYLKTNTDDGSGSYKVDEVRPLVWDVTDPGIQDMYLVVKRAVGTVSGDHTDLSETMASGWGNGHQLGAVAVEVFLQKAAVVFFTFVFEPDFFSIANDGGHRDPNRQAPHRESLWEE